MKKLFCFDIDGTLRTTTDHQVPESTVKALNLLREKGHLLLVSTGRSVDSLKNTHIYDTFSFDGYVCNSGQALLDKDLNLIHKENLSREVVLKALEASKKHNIPLGYDYQEFKAIDELDVMVGESSYADITIKGISKATGIAYFMKLWNIDNYVAFGDSLNDVEMFKHASFSICMGQGNSDLKRLSDFVTTSIDEDGIYYACKELGYIQ